MQLNNVLEWYAHKLCCLHGIPEVIDYLRQIVMGQVVWVIFLIVHYEAKLRFPVELLFLQVFAGLIQFSFKHVHFLELRIQEAEKYLFPLS